MTTRTHSDFLDLNLSEDDGSQGYDSEADVVQKGGRESKRRRVESQGSEDDDLEEEFGEVESDHDEEECPTGLPNGSTVEDGGGREAESASEATAKEKRKRDSKELPSGISKPLTKKNLVATAAAIKRSGVVYLSRIPPFMKPTKLRSLLEPYGAINRIFLSPEDPASHTRRVRNGGNKKRSFNDGWVEFVNKKDAKHVCELLNARTIGGKKGTYYHDDVWNLLYLKGFKWNNLTEQIAAENAERASRMRAEISKTTRENKEFVLNVDRAKMQETMESKKAAKRRKENEGGAEIEEGTAVKEGKSGKQRPLYFKQTPVAAKKSTGDQPEQLKRVLNKIF